ncbi:cell division protein FtsL [Pontibacillus litoralis]|uniref:Cell division protein FtsL n=1 Tax=Pontibacillus litoralis JSM 072002 TaxID=1385512 RepID=A0A0A5GBT0_9BACI|nr:cell division protein FtsL [Pontibacillus litoralis]KGX88545.1 hypothetical protein N784_07700 [Pontibacillus litoralis JSM 072002]
MSAENAKKLYKEQPAGNLQQPKVKVHVHKKKWISTGEKFMYSIVGTMAIAACVYVVSFASATDQVNRDLQKLEGQVDAQQVNVQNLEYEVKELSKPERILSIAEKNGLEIQKSKVKSVELGGS